MRSAKRWTSIPRTSARVGGSSSRSPRMSVMKPGVSSSAPPKITSTPSSTSRAGGRPACSATLKRRHAAPPLRAHQQRAEDRVGDQDRDRPPHADLLADLDEHGQLGDRHDDEDQDAGGGASRPRTLRPAPTRLRPRPRAGGRARRARSACGSAAAARRSRSARPSARSRWASTARSIISDGSAKRSSERSTQTSRGACSAADSARRRQRARRPVLIPRDEQHHLL